MDVDPPIRNGRRSARKPTVMIARVKKATGLTDRVVIQDLTAEGCLISMGTLQASVGQQVTIRPEGLDAFTGTIRWLADGRAGIEFTKALYTPVVEHLQKKHATFLEVGRPRSNLRPAW